MPDGERNIVVNTTPLITITVATGSLEVLRRLYSRVIVPLEVEEEILAAGALAAGVAAFNTARWLERLSQYQSLPTFLQNSLDKGEASVIQAAFGHGIKKVCIDEKVGRRIARLSGLTVTGSIGVLVKARQQGYTLDVEAALSRLHAHGIWIGKEVERFFRQMA